VEKPLEEYDEDIELPELREELGSDIVDLLINNEFETAVDVLKAGVDKLKVIEGFDEEKAKKIIEVLENQFEDED